ncbi:maleylpyruvate isomerase family mycothiol-dependent enzyme [Mycolicibacterium thermoresistibile]
MSITALDKTDILDGLFEVWDDITALGAQLTDAQWQTPTALPGWSVHDVIAHLIGIESMLQGVDTPEADIDVTTLDHVRNDIGALNERWIRTLRSVEPAALLDQWRTVTAQRREALTAIGADDWNAVTATPAGPDSYGRFMRIRIFDCWMHEHDIREVVGRPVADDAVHTRPARLALDEMAAAMGLVVARRGQAPDGARVRIALTGPLARNIDVAVQDRRGHVVGDFGGAQPTTLIEMDGFLFTRLAGGRTTPAQHPDAVTYRGDEAVGRRIVDNLDYVI